MPLPQIPKCKVPLLDEEFGDQFAHIHSGIPYLFILMVPGIQWFNEQSEFRAR